MSKCLHTSVTVCHRLIAQATRYEPAEYDEWAECDECGKQMDLSDAAGAPMLVLWGGVEVCRTRPAGLNLHLDNRLRKLMLDFYLAMCNNTFTFK